MTAATFHFPLTRQPSLWERMVDFVTGPSTLDLSDNEPVLGAEADKYQRPTHAADYVLVREYGNNTLVGVMAGMNHGQAGALLTMIARSVLDDAIRLAGRKIRLACCVAPTATCATS